jgi:CRISPR-associated protein Cas8c/Csp2
MNIHPYLRYAQALVMYQNHLSSCEEIGIDHIKNEIENGLNHFRIQTTELPEGKETVKYDFGRIQQGNPKKGIFLAPNAITSDMQAKNLWTGSIKYLDTISNQNINKLTDIGMSEVPISGEFLSFSENGNIGRGNPKASYKEQGLALISTLTNLKPCLQYKIGKKGQPETFNICIIPDLPLEKMIDFINLFKKMNIQGLKDVLMCGNVTTEVNKKGEIVSYVPRRPQIYNGNFPNAPKSSALGSVALLGAIGEFAKHADVSRLGMSVLDSLKDATMYMIKYGGASTFTYNHFVVDLAKEGKLSTIIDSLYYSKLYNQDRRTSSNTEYQKFDLFTSRFLQLFSRPAFKDFLSFRAEYPESVIILFNTYFKKMEKIDPKIVDSARQLGKWLNLVAYFAAKEVTKNEAPNYWEEVRKAKSKVLVELESSTFSAKSGDALIAQAITRAGRISDSDAPEAAALFMEKTASGELPLDNAKNLLIAFSRLRNGKQTEDQKENGIKDYCDNSEPEDGSND